MAPVGISGRYDRAEAAKRRQAATNGATKSASVPTTGHSKAATKGGTPKPRTVRTSKIKAAASGSATDTRAATVKAVRAITRVNGKYAPGYGPAQERRMIAERERQAKWSSPKIQTERSPWAWSFSGGWSCRVPAGTDDHEKPDQGLCENEFHYTKFRIMWPLIIPSSTARSTAKGAKRTMLTQALINVLGVATWYLVGIAYVSTAARLWPLKEEMRGKWLPSPAKDYLDENLPNGTWANFPEQLKTIIVCLAFFGLLSIWPVSVYNHAKRKFRTKPGNHGK